MRCVAVILVALLGACGDREVTQLERIKQTVCACKTPACAEDALKAVPKADIKASHRAQRVAGQIRDCIARLTEEASDAEPATDPETSGSASARTP